MTYCIVYCFSQRSFQGGSEWSLTESRHGHQRQQGVLKRVGWWNSRWEKEKKQEKADTKEQKGGEDEAGRCDLAPLLSTLLAHTILSAHPVFLITFILVKHIWIWREMRRLKKLHCFSKWLFPVSLSVSSSQRLFHYSNCLRVTQNTATRFSSGVTTVWAWYLKKASHTDRVWRNGY